MIEKSAWHNSVLKSRVIVLAGAGASAPLGMPTMDEFFKLLNFKDSFLEGAFSALDAPQKDIEGILGRLAYYEALQDQVLRDDNLRKVVSGVDGIKGLASAAKVCRERIFDRIVATYGRLSNEAKTKAESLYKNFYLTLLESAGNDPRVLPIFTTNYDLTFEAIRERSPDFGFCTGLSLQGEDRIWDPLAYEMAKDHPFAIFRLHGCSHWMKDKQTERIFYQALPDRKDLTAKQPCILYPVPGKDDRLDEEPFRTGYRYLELCLRIAKIILIIGYSGRDSGIQKLLSDALEVDSERLLIVVSKGATLRPEFNDLKKRCRQFWHIERGIEEKSYLALQHVRDFRDSGQ